jgi:hypothetical protein
MRESRENMEAEESFLSVLSGNRKNCFGVLLRFARERVKIHILFQMSPQAT